MRQHLIVAASLLGSVSLLAGCAADKHVIESYHHMPATLYVLDAETREPLWVMPVPPGQRLDVKFDHNRHRGDFTAQKVPADFMNWYLRPEMTTGMFRLAAYRPRQSGRVELLGTPVRMEVVYDRPYRGEQGAGSAGFQSAMQEQEQGEDQQQAQPATEPQPQATPESAQTGELEESAAAPDSAEPAETRDQPADTEDTMFR